MEAQGKTAGPSEHIEGPATLNIFVETEEDDLWVSVKDGTGTILVHEELDEHFTTTLNVEKGMYWVRVLPVEAELNLRGVAVGMPIWVD
jgi:hypothetical protein